MDADRPLAPNPYEKPVYTEAPEPRPEARVPPGKEPAGFARRLAGGMMLANGVLVILEAALTSAPSAPSPTGSPVAYAVGSLLDIVIGITLLTGSSALARFAMVRCALGLTIGVALRAKEGPIVIVTQVLMCVSLLGLLAGKAERVRTAIAGSAMGLYLAAQMLAIASLATGANPLAAVLLASAGDIEPTPVTRAAGVRVPYELTFPPGEWYPRKPERFAKENPLVDRWFTRPEDDVHVLVIVEHVPDRHFPIDTYADAVIANTKQDAPALVVTAREPWRLHPERGRLVKAAGMREGIAFEWHYAMLATYERAFYLVAIGSAETMTPLHAEIAAIFDSFRLPASVMDALPPDLVPGPAGKVTGDHMPYSLTAPGDEWHLRKPEAYKAENGSIDRWLNRRDLDAHVIVVAEETPPGTVLPPGRYKDAVIESMKEGTKRFEVLSDEPWAKHPEGGYRVRLSLSRDDIDLDYELGIYARLNRGFQVQAFAPKATFAAARADLVKGVESFEPPPPPPP